MEYLASGGILHSLDMTTRAKVRFPGAAARRDPASAGAGTIRCSSPARRARTRVEAALKLARKVTGRRTVVAFSNGFHGMTLGVAGGHGQPVEAGGGGGAARAQRGRCRSTAACPTAATRWGNWRRASTGRRRSGRRRSFLETIQAEGGVNVAGDAWAARAGGAVPSHRRAADRR